MFSVNLDDYQDTYPLSFDNISPGKSNENTKSGKKKRRAVKKTNNKNN